MKCPTCRIAMEHRNGKYGGFWYCPDHGTISDRLVEHIKTWTPSGNITHPNDTDLMFQIERKTMDFGIKPSELEAWIVDDPDAADYEEDHWMNIRPY